MDITVQPIGNFGVLVIEPSLSDIVANDLASALTHLLAKHQILLFRGQQVNPEQQVRLTRFFGELDPTIPQRPESHRLHGFPDILYLSNAPASSTRTYGRDWHSDGLHYSKTPRGATLLHCVSCPNRGGDTLFADQYASYASLPKAIKDRIQDLYWYLPLDVLHSEANESGGLAQPMVRVHGVTERRFVYCSPAARRIRGLSQQESEALLSVVHEHQIREEVVYRHRWQPGDFIVWENSTLLHSRADAVDFVRDGPRIMHRSASMGDFSAIECEAPPTLVSEA